MFLMVRTKDDYLQYGFITVLAANASNILNLVNANKYIGFSLVALCLFGINVKYYVVYNNMSLIFSAL